MADDVSGVVVRHRVVAVALTWIRKAAPRRGPARDVERRELQHGDGPAPVAAEGPVGNDEDVEDPRIARVEVRELAPVVRRGAARRLVIAEDPLVQAGRHLVRRAARLERDAVPGLWGPPDLTRRRGARDAWILGVRRRAAVRELVL